MERKVRKEGRSQEKKVYVTPRLEKSQRLEDITQGVVPVVTGAVPD